MMKSITKFIIESSNIEAKKIAIQIKKDNLISDLDNIVTQLFAAEDEREYPQIEEYPDLLNYDDLFEYDDRGYICELSDLGKEVADILGI